VNSLAYCRDAVLTAWERRAETAVGRGTGRGDVPAEVAPALLEPLPGHHARCHLREAGSAVPRAAFEVTLEFERAAEAARPVLLQVEDLKVHFPIKRGVLRRTVGHVKAVDGVSFQLAEGDQPVQHKRKDGTPYDYHRGLYSFRVKSRIKDVGVYRPEHRWEFAGGLALEAPAPRPELDLHDEGEPDAS